MLTLAGAKIESVIHFNPENAYTVLRVIHQRQRYCVVGQAPELLNFGNIRKAIGVACDIDGNFVKHPKYGSQFQIERLTIQTDGMRFFLVNFVSGIGESLANKLIEYYGETRLEEIIRNNPYELTKFKGIKRKKAERIAKSFIKYSVMLEISKLFSKHGVKITPNIVLKIYNYFLIKAKEQGQDNVDISYVEKTLYNDIFELTEIDGIGFKTVDKIAKDLGYEKTDVKRIASLTYHTIYKQAMDNGHTYLQIDELIGSMIEEAGDDVNLSEAYKEVILNNTNFLHDCFSIEIINERIVTLTHFKMKEKYIFDWTAKRASRRHSYRISHDKAEEYIKEKEQELKITLSDEQKKAIMDIATKGYSFYILCGYAGTGKSTISKLILDFYSRFFNTDEIVTTAFTGMASKRIQETSGYTGKTIHRLLEYNGAEKKFKHNEYNKLEYNVILIDEASMINLSLFYSLLRAIDDRTIVIMVGDDAQLPPIGEGNVFSDLLKLEHIPQTKLTRIYRQSTDSVITYFANQVRQGEIPNIVPNYKYKDFYGIIKNPNIDKSMEEKEKDEIKQKFYESMKDLMIEHIDMLKAKIGDSKRSIMDIQVITPQKRSVLGTEQFNDALQDILNSEQTAVNIRGYKLKLYDKVIHLKNIDMPITEKDADFSSLTDDDISEERVYNGSIGQVVYIDNDDETFIVDYGDYRVIYSFDHFKDIIDLGYALTVHKTQGSQFKYVFLPVMNLFYVMLNNKLLYTAMTRAKEKLFFYGQTFAIRRSCETLFETSRQTFLSNIYLLGQLPTA